MIQLDQSQYLINQIRDGDQSAFSELMRPLIEKAYRTSYFILRSPHCAEDVVQKAMIEAYSNIISGKQITHFTSWFHHLVSCRAVDAIRKNARQKQKEGIDISQLDVAEPQTAIDYVLNAEIRNEVNNAVLSIENIAYRTVIVMYYYQELKISEIADILGLKEATVKTHLRRAREELRKTLRDNNLIEVT